MTGRARRPCALAAAATVAIGVLVGALGSGLAGADGPVDGTGLPRALHGAVETQALTLANSAPPVVPELGGFVVDPGTAYAYSTLDRDDYGGSVSFTMTARGANVNPGTIAAAVLWAPPVCGGAGRSANPACIVRNPTDAVAAPTRPSGGNPSPTDIGLNTASGFPAYAEALFPPPPEGAGASQERVYKCIVSKDGPGSPPTAGQAAAICKGGGTSVPFTAWAETIGSEVRSTGFSRVAGTDIPGVVRIGTSESSSDVRPEKGGLLRSYGYSTLSNVSILGGQITIDGVRSDAEVVAGPGQSKRMASSCTFSGLRVAGQQVQRLSGGELAPAPLKPLLDAVLAATQIKVDIVTPPLPRVETVEGGKRVAECSGLQIVLTDTRTQPPLPVCLPIAPPPPPDQRIRIPQCVPASGLNEVLQLGRVSVQQSVNNVAGVPGSALNEVLPGALGGVPGGLESAGGGALGSVPSPGGSVAGLAPEVGGSGTAPGTVGVSPGLVAAGPGYKLVRPNLAHIGALAAGAAGLFALCIWLLIAVVGAISTGVPLGRSGP